MIDNILFMFHLCWFMFLKDTGTEEQNYLCTIYVDLCSWLKGHKSPKICHKSFAVIDNILFMFYLCRFMFLKDTGWRERWREGYGRDDGRDELCSDLWKPLCTKDSLKGDGRDEGFFEETSKQKKFFFIWYFAHLIVSLQRSILTYDR